MILNAPMVTNDFLDDSALFDVLVELKGECFFSVFIGKYPQFIVFVITLTTRIAYLPHRLYNVHK